MPVLQPDVIERFQTDGYVLSESLLTTDEVDRYGAVVDRAVARRTADDQRSLEQKTSYEQSFVQCMRLWETDPEVAPLTFHIALAEAAAELLAVERVRLWQDQALYKESGGRITDAHQDATFWPIGDTPLVSAWIPLDGSTLEGGAVGYVPGSHKLGKLKTVNLTETTEAYDILSDPALEGAEPRYVEAPKGSVVWHHGMTVHAALANRSGVTRRAFTVVYFADGFRRAKPWSNFPLDRAGVGVGELMEGEGLPLVWPRGGDQYPAVPMALGQATGPQVGT
ncbi:MAG: phytanoyl-CoA dioxygenase family protein [Acidimicrobiales bacterium]|jgi:ectoine hydroxylase-related dioxygenase (phytanoyl-CoA dioxygenase family)